MWIGLKHDDDACNSPEDCSGEKLWHHEPGKSDSDKDDIKHRFIHEGWLDVKMNFGDGKFCGAMEGAYGYGEHQRQNDILSKDCNGVAPFVCTSSCYSKLPLKSIPIAA